MKQRGRQIVYISADGRYLFMGANDLSVSSRANLLRVVRIDGYPSLGPRDAPVLIVEFGDFQCPPCRITGTAKGSCARIIFSVAVPFQARLGSVRI